MLREVRRGSHWAQLTRFATVGASGYAVNLAVYVLALDARLDYRVAAAVAFCVAVVNSFAWNRLWTFRDANGRVGVQAFRCVLTSCAAFRQAIAIAAVWHDGHNGKLRAVDGFANRLVPRIVRALGPRGVLFITWDEGRDSDTRGAHGRGGGRVPLIAVGPGARRHTRVPVLANHYALLKTLEAAFRVPGLGHAADRRTPMLTGLLRR